jgi:hypothetical protein
MDEWSSRELLEHAKVQLYLIDPYALKPLPREVRRDVWNEIHMVVRELWRRGEQMRMF